MLPSWSMAPQHPPTNCNTSYLTLGFLPSHTNHEMRRSIRINIDLGGATGNAKEREIVGVNSFS